MKKTKASCKEIEPTIVVETKEPEKVSAMPLPPTHEETPGIVSFFANYWQFVLWGVVSLALVLNNQVFKFLGSLIYLPLLVFSVYILAFVIRHVLNKTSTASYVKEGAYDKDFAGLTPLQKTVITQAQFAIYLIVIAMLAARVLG